MAKARAFPEISNLIQRLSGASSQLASMARLEKGTPYSTAAAPAIKQLLETIDMRELKDVLDDLAFSEQGEGLKVAELLGRLPMVKRCCDNAFPTGSLVRNGSNFSAYVALLQVRKTGALAEDLLQIRGNRNRFRTHDSELDAELFGEGWSPGGD